MRKVSSCWLKYKCLRKFNKLSENLSSLLMETILSKLLPITSFCSDKFVKAASKNSTLDSSVSTNALMLSDLITSKNLPIKPNPYSTKISVPFHHLKPVSSPFLKIKISLTSALYKKIKWKSTLLRYKKYSKWFWKSTSWSKVPQECWKILLDAYFISIPKS